MKNIKKRRVKKEKLILAAVLLLAFLASLCYLSFQMKYQKKSAGKTIVDWLRAVSKIFFSKRQTRRYYSQFGEDALLAELFGRRKKEGVYVDIGCYHPRKHSNTYMFYKRGWNGILVDIEQAKINACRILRPRDKALLSAVSDERGKLPFYGPKRFSVLTSLNRRREDFKLLGHIDCVTLTELLDTHLEGNNIDLLSIDVEGYDYKVLKGLDFSLYTPGVIVIESWAATDIDSVLESDIHLHLKEYGYKLRGWTGLSLIYEYDSC